MSRVQNGANEIENDPSAASTAALDGLLYSYGKDRNPLEVDFRRLVPWVKLGDQLTHQIHPYPAKLLPHIAHAFVRASQYRGGSGEVLDPFCGSGTVALEASVAGRAALVADANPFAVLVTRVKTTPYSARVLEGLLIDILRTAKRSRTAPEISIVNSHLWYHAPVKRKLERIADAIDGVPDGAEKDFFSVCLSSAARRLSLADPAISVPVRLKESSRHSDLENEKIKSRLYALQNPDVWGEFERVARQNIERVRLTNVAAPSRCAATFAGNDAKQLFSKWPGRRSGSIPLVITSPPYGSAQKYIRASSLSLNWLKLAPPEALAVLESGSIGREHVHRSREVTFENDLPAKFSELVNRLSGLNPNRARITEIYLQELRSALVEIHRVLVPGGSAVLVIGNNQVCGQVLRTDDFIDSVMTEHLGMEKELHLLDDIKSRGLMTKRNRTASVISRESVLVFRKAK